MTIPPPSLPTPIIIRLTGSEFKYKTQKTWEISTHLLGYSYLFTPHLTLNLTSKKEQIYAFFVLIDCLFITQSRPIVENLTKFY